jgi:hypothetical protein
MDENPERLNQVLARWWRKVLATESSDIPEDWAYWEETDASLRDARQSQDGEDQKTVTREAA